MNGYHAFCVKPEKIVPLGCEREPRIQFDKNAIKIIIPETDTTVGRMPKKCCKIVAPFMDTGGIASVSYTHLTLPTKA